MYLEDELADESQPSFSRQYYIVICVVAVVAIVGGIAYGGYRIFQDAQEAKNSINYSPDYFAIGQQLVNEGEFRSAIELFEGLAKEDALRNRRRHLGSRSWTACCYNALGEFEQAEKILNDLHRDGQLDTANRMQNRFFLACTLASQGRDDEAIEALSEYLLLGGVYPRPDNTFKVASQLQQLEDSGRIQELLDRPQMDFEFVYGWRSAIGTDTTYAVGSTFAEVDLEMQSMSLTYRVSGRDQREFDPWQMICYWDTSKEVWRARLVTQRSAIGEFSGELEDGRLHMTGTWIPATGGVPCPAKLEFTRDRTNPNRTRVRILRSLNGSSDWSRAQRVCDMGILRN